MTPTLKNLQYLIALKKTNHFSKAASECFVSPSTFSAGISKLEQDLEILLVERDNKNVAFTPIGNRIVNQAISVMTEMTTLVETAKLDFFESEVTIGVIPTISTYILPNFLSNLEKSYPKLKASFREDTSDNLLKQLEKATIDFAIFAFPYFAINGPRTNMDALIVFTNSYLASISFRLADEIVKSIFSSSKISAPIEPDNSNMVVIS